MNKEDGMRFIPQAELKSRVVYRHPNGRFDVIERCGIGVLGIPYRICEAVLTPERDKRGIACKKALPDSGFTVRKSTARKHSYKRIGPREAEMIADMYQNGCNYSRIARELGRDHTSISAFIRRNNIKSRPRNCNSENGKQL